MRRKYIVALDSSTAEQNEEFRKYIKKNGMGWWHWLNNFWLLTDSEGKKTAGDIRTDIRKFFPGIRLLVLQIDKEGDTWAGFGPNSDEKNMFTWLKSTWDKDLD
ncbi:hypothetical protein [Serratia sp. FDAARGOS_506]|uniref:hypothetical protein n=1 Tax=Serratia TaxID=613 RepID=UPI000F4DB197|nr:hypothetical protein [Serratia sp. FDAARGOS_506]AYZ32601.1 hypothetical protein EGY12_16475 [Serratia sp. FDAARGOS_506]